MHQRDKIVVYTWARMTNNKKLQGNKYYPLLNVAREIDH